MTDFSVGWRSTVFHPHQWVLTVERAQSATIRSGKRELHWQELELLGDTKSYPTFLIASFALSLGFIILGIGAIIVISLSRFAIVPLIGVYLLPLGMLGCYVILTRAENIT